MKIQLADKTSFKRLVRKHSAHLLRATTFDSIYRPTSEEYLHSTLAIPAVGSISHELFLTDDQVRHRRVGAIDIAETDQESLLQIVVPEPPEGAFRGALSQTGLYQAGYIAYEQLLELISQESLGELARIWNYVPQILETAHPELPRNDRERYRQFNAGRCDAWNEHGLKDAEGVFILPAATGIGAHNGPLVVECLVTKHAVIHIENPRQIPAYNYPPKYGTKPPVFARGSLVTHGSQSELYISGTASIVGSETRHIGNVPAQVQETFTNIKTLIGKDNLERYQHPGFDLSDISAFRVYIKNKADYADIRKEVEHVVGRRTPVVYVNDDICRPNLLLEIEGVALLKTT